MRRIDGHENLPGVRRRRIGKRLILMLAVFVIAVFAWLIVERYVGKHRLSKYEAVLRANGEKLTIAELLPAVPEGKNAGVEVSRLCAALQDGETLPSEAPPPQMRLIAPGKAMLVSTRPHWTTFVEKRETNDWNAVRDDLGVNNDTLTRLRSELRSPVLHKRLNYEDGFKNLDTRHLMALKKGAQWLAASGAQNLHDRNFASAYEDLECLLALLRMQSTEHLVINQLVRLAIEHFAVALSWEGLTINAWDDRMLEALQREWAALDFVQPMIQSLRMERAMGRPLFEEARQSIDVIQEIYSWRSATIIADAITGSSLVARVVEDTPVGDTVIKFVEEQAPDAIRRAVIFPIWQFAWSHDDQRQSWKNFQIMIDGARDAAEHASAQELEKAHGELEKFAEPRGLCRLRHLLSPMSQSVAYAPRRAFQGQTHVQMTLCAIALQRHHRNHGQYPENLDALTPALLSKPPIDYMNGDKLHYRREERDFTLWSVGNDGKDNGGDGGELDAGGKPQQLWKAPDSLWPRPATEAEVREYEHRLRR